MSTTGVEAVLYDPEETSQHATATPICSGQPSFDVKMPCHTRLNDASFTARYHYDDECDAHRCRRLRKLKGWL